jgi:hypothetical protein
MGIKRPWFQITPIVGVLVSCGATAGLSQSGPVSVEITARAVPAFTTVDPVPGGSSLTETKVEQPILNAMADALNQHLQFTGTLDFEGLTMPNGVLTVGGWGEGFNERRHPHTWAHELILSGTAGPMSGSFRGSLSVGKGFVAFGTDDPMNRPALRFPVNHHWSQILERALVTAGLKTGPLVTEATLFNGDEPEHWDQWPMLSRFGDSWALRFTVTPVTGLEVQGSRAHVHSPEHRPGAGPDQEKWDFSARLERPLRGSPLYLMSEWAKTDEAEGLFHFYSWLIEGSWTTPRHRPYYRFELTDRPEEERLLDLFRSVRPHLENSIIGVSRWAVHTAGYGYTVRFSRISLEPLAEVSFAKVSKLGAGLFDPEGFFGRNWIWSLTFGVVIQAPGPMHRMGRYGVSSPMMHNH